jgi:hypothetical protein
MAAPAVQQRPPARRPQRGGSPRGPFDWATSRQALAALAAVALIALLAQGAVSLVIGLRARSTFSGLHDNTAPAITAAQNLRADVQEMDGDLTNALLQYGLAAPDKQDWRGNRAQATKAVLTDLALLQARISQRGECDAVAALRDGVADYSTYAAQAEQAERNAGASVATGGAAASSALPADVVTLYNLAADVVLNRIDPAIVAGSPDEAAVPTTALRPVATCTSTVRPAVSTAGGLYTIHTAQEQRAYDSGRRTLLLGGVAAVLVGLVALAAIVLTGLSAARQTHRLIAPGVAAGGLLAIVILAGTLALLISLNSRLHSASNDELPAVETALQIKGIASIANADESRWLFATDRVQAWQNDFNQSGARIATLIKQASDNAANTALRQSMSGIGGQAVTPGCAAGVAPAWATYLNLDKQLRQSQQQGQHAAAVALKLGSSNNTFADVIACADRYQQLSAARFNDTANSGSRDALLLAIVGVGVAAAGALLLLIGARNRLADL